MQYPVFISVSDAARIFGIGRTTVYKKITSGDFTTAKIGRATRITFSSAIQFAMRCLAEGNSRGALSEVFGECVTPVENAVVAETLAWQLCHTHCEPVEVPENNSDGSQSSDVPTGEAGSREKNIGGEI